MSAMLCPFQIIHRRENQNLDFAMDWVQYQNGFGNLTEPNFWLGKGTFKYHMTLREGSRGFAQTVRVPSYREEGWPNCHITFIVAKKSLIYSLFSFIFGICGGRMLV